MASSDQLQYEELVREQLRSLGYNSDAIPTEVLREFLADFEHMDLGEDADQAAAPLSYPTALSSAEAHGVGASPTPRQGTEGARSAALPRSASVREGTRKTAVNRKPPSRAGNRPRTVGSGVSSAAAGGSLRSCSTDKAEADELTQQSAFNSYAAALDEPEGEGEDASGAMPPPPVPVFDRAHWESLRPADADGALPASARTFQSASACSSRFEASRPSSARPRLASSSMIAGGLAVPPMGFSGSGVIIPTSSITGSTVYGGTPRHAKSDPVSMHARRLQQWRTDPYLHSSSSKRHTVPASPAPLQTVAASRRRVNTYEVPTSKRRDELVWQTRLRMRAADPDAYGGKSARAMRSKAMVPNRFVPATEKRRDDLRWAIRSEMAWMQ